MISRIDGQLVEVLPSGRALLQCEHITYEILLPAADHQRLAAHLDQAVTFHTLHYLEGQGQGSSFIPRLIGFASSDDRAFFELFITVKGLGMRKALRALTLPFGRVAGAIAARDVDLLRSLPEIGKRTAESIIAELHGKVDDFVTAAPEQAADADAAAAQSVDETTSDLARDAVHVLTMLGEPKMQATQLVQRALAVDGGIDSPEALVAAAYRLKDLP
jgi:Holliday junction DNA helicase RuvA